MTGTRVVLIDRPGGPEVLRLDEREAGEPGPGEVLLRHTAIGVNFIDVQHRSGRYPLPSYPAPIGFEAAAVVERLGEGVDALRVGDRVAYGAPPPGSYADRRCLPATLLVPVPDNVGDEMAASLLNKGITAHYLLHATRPVSPGETILVHAAAGGVGSLLCQWAAAKGARVIGTVGSAGKIPVAVKNGCAFVINYTEEDFAERVRAITGGAGVPAVFDSVGRSTFEGSLRCIADRGLLVSFGTASGAIPPLDLFRLNQMGSLFVTSPAFVTHTKGREQLLSRAAAVFAAVASGTLRLDPPRVYPLEQAAAAHRDMQDRSVLGVAVLRPA